MQGQFTNQFVNDFFQTGRPTRHVKREIILGWEEKLGHIYLIQKGFIKVYSLSNNGQELIHYIYGPGDIFPLPWAFTGSSREDYYESLGNTMLYKVGLPRFQEFCQSSVFISNAFSLLVAQLLDQYSDRINNLEHKKPNQRLAYRLVSLAHDFGYRDGDHVIIDGPFTHQLIADTINLARETVSRGIAFMEDAGLVEQKDRRIIIKDLPGLMERIHGNAGPKNWQLDSELVGYRP